MKLGLSMIIKNEKNNLKKYLSKIYDLFDDLVIVDTHSTDGSIEYIKKLGIKVVEYNFTNSDERLIEARNLSIVKNSCDLTLILDGDEFISREDIIKLKNFLLTKDNVEEDGYFLKRMNYTNTRTFEDYKMALVNKNRVRFLFSVHACPQVYVRDMGGFGSWLNGITIEHYQEYKDYRENYITQLKNGILENPSCFRYYWFLGYHYFKENLYEEAKLNFNKVINNKSLRFPVETLNSYMILSKIYQDEGSSIEAFNIIMDALNFYDLVKNDFEVKINFRLYNWLVNTKEKLLIDENCNITPYEFAY